MSRLNSRQNLCTRVHNNLHILCTSYYLYLSSLNIYREYSEHNQSKRNGKQRRLNTMLLCATEIINFYILYKRPPDFGLSEYCLAERMGKYNLLAQKLILFQTQKYRFFSVL